MTNNNRIAALDRIADAYYILTKRVEIISVIILFGISKPIL